MVTAGHLDDATGILIVEPPPMEVGILERAASRQVATRRPYNVSFWLNWAPVFLLAGSAAAAGVFRIVWAVQ